jgi:hypothetical protein
LPQTNSFVCNQQQKNGNSDFGLCIVYVPEPSSYQNQASGSEMAVSVSMFENRFRPRFADMCTGRKKIHKTTARWRPFLMNICLSTFLFCLSSSEELFLHTLPVDFDSIPSSTLLATVL